MAILILNWNNATDTVECLDSVSALDYPDYHVVVVDNGSTDDSVRAIRQQYPEMVILETQRNLGYAGGNNVGIRYALSHGAEYVCILNNDVKVAPDFLDHLMASLCSRAEIGIVAPLIAGESDPERVWALGLTVDWQTGVVDRGYAGASVSALKTEEPLEVDIATGTAMLVKREVFDRVGSLDEAFYLYFEEADWCLRVRRAGYRILAVPSSVVWHKVSATLGQTSPAADYYMLRNHLFFIMRHWSGAARVRLLGHTVFRDFLTIAAYTLKSHSRLRIPHRNARLMALRDAILGRWGKMGQDVVAVCRRGDR